MALVSLFSLAVATILPVAPAPNFGQGGIEEPTFSKPKNGDEVAVITTKFGKIIIKFRADKAPKHVDNFKTLAKKGVYDKTIFHRVIPGFMIQGGDPNTKGSDTSTYGMGGPGSTVKQEFNNLDHKRGVLSMARSQDPDGRAGDPHRHPGGGATPQAGPQGPQPGDRP